MASSRSAPVCRIRGSKHHFFRLNFLYYVVMAKSIIVLRKKRGRPPTGQDPVMAVRLPRELTERIDEWMKHFHAPTRSDAIRQLIELGLNSRSAQPKKPRKTGQ
jgi:hypothetical protein